MITISKVWATKAKIGKWDFNKLKKFCSAKTAINRVKGKPTGWQKYLQNCFWKESYDKPSSVQLLSRVQLLVSLWTAARQASLSITNSQSLLKLMSIKLVMPSNHLILCRPLLLLPSIFPSIRVFSNESVLHIRWPKYWSFSFNISPSSEYSGLISFRLDWLDSLAVQGTLGPFRYDLNQIPYDKPSESESRSGVSDSL